MEIIMAYIYKISNNINGKFYIGKTTRKTINRRWWEHQQNIKKVNYRHPLYDGMRHYGLDNFSLEIIEECEKNILDEREIFWIQKLNPSYNLTDGGEGGDTFTNKPEYMKEETRKKLSEASKANWEKEEYRQKISEGCKAAWEKEEYRQRVTKSLKETFSTPESKKKRSFTMREVANKNRKVWSECKTGKKNGRWLGYVHMFDGDGNLIKIYESAVECSRDTGIVAHNIRTKAISGESMLRGKYFGYTFKIV